MTLKKTAVLFGACAAIGVAGCSSTGVDNINSYESVPLSESPQMPNPEALQGGAQEVVVFGFEGDDPAGIDRIIRSDLENYIGAAGADIVDRSAASRLGEEVQRAELEGDGAYDGPPVADVAIGGRINSANFGYEFQHARRNDDGDRIPPQCRFSASVNTDVRVYAIPSLDIVDTIRTEGSASNTTEASRSSDCRRYSGDSLIQEAAENAIRSERDGLQNMFTPEGYVESYLLNADEDDHLLRITLGSNLGAAEGNDVEIIRKEELENGLTGDVTIQESVVAEGIITEIVHPTSSVVRLEDGEQAQDVMVGDTVKQVFETGFIENIIESF